MVTAKSKQKIGILAGMGPKSTAPFINQVIEQYQTITGATHDIDFPPIMIYALPTPFYIDRPIDHVLMEKTICAGLKQLADCETAFMAIPCITAHLYFDKLRQCTQVPLLNMVDIAIQGIPQNIRKIAILATRPTFESLLFQKRLKKTNCEVIFHIQWQDKIDEMISRIKKGAPQSTWLFIWNSLAKELESANVEALLIACTDLNLLFNTTNSPFQIIDSSLCLANAIVHKWVEVTSPY